MRGPIDINHFMIVAWIFVFGLISALAGVAFADTRVIDPVTVLCPKVKLLVGESRQ